MTRDGRRPSILAALPLLAALLAAAVSLSVASPASAHAMLLGSTPAPDSVLRAPPHSVELLFNEGITLLPDSVRVFGPEGGRVDDAVVGRPHGDAATVSVGLRPGLPEGTYLVSYRVVSADSHPISGAYTFSVGHPTQAPTSDGVASGGDGEVDIALGLARWLGYAGSALGLGGFAFLAWCWPAGWASRRARLLVFGGVGALTVGTVLALVLKGPYDEGTGLGSVTEGPLLRQVLATTYGQALDARLLLIAALVLVLTYRDKLPPPVLRVAPAMLLVGVGVTFALCGHAAAGGHRPVAVASDTAHMVAMSIWLGGLSMLLGVVLVRTDGEAVHPPVLRFSTMATGAVTVLIASGVYQTLREVGSWDVLLHTHYGHLLVVKLAIAGTAFLAAAGSRTWVWQTVSPVVPVHAATSAPAETDVDGSPDLGRLRLSVALETVLLIGVLVATAMLVTSDPARPSTPTGPVVSTVAVGHEQVRVSVVPEGTRRIRVSLTVRDEAGRPAEPKEIDASLTLPATGIGPLPITLEKTGAGQRMGHVSVPLAGSWRLAVTVRTSAVDEQTGYVDVPVG